jgi:imidazolonepropionase
MENGNLLIYNIGNLVQVRKEVSGPVFGKNMQELPQLPDAWLWIKNGYIEDYGSMENCPDLEIEKIDAESGLVLPAWCDSHTHIVYEGSREGEFIDKIKGLTYEEIAKKGGGILQSAMRLRAASEESLYQQALRRLNEVIDLGTGAIEIKSGYGLDLESELKILRVIKRLKEVSPIPIKSTFLGAHAVPPEFKGNQSSYVDYVIDVMLPAVASEGLADFCDVFCDRGFFTPEESERILTAGKKYGLIPKLHANELDYSGGVQAGVKVNAISVDHLECVGDAELEALKASNVIPTLLPGTAFFLRLEYAPARAIIAAGLPVALATDYNPGTCPSGNMPFVLSLACIHMRMLPEEAINAATINSSFAMGLGEKVGAICSGFLGNVIITRPVQSIAFLPYAFGTNWIKNVVLNGKIRMNNHGN